MYSVKQWTPGLLFVLFVSLALAGCDSTSSSDDADSDVTTGLEGSYTLQAILDKTGRSYGVEGLTLIADDETEATITSGGVTFDVTYVVRGTLTMTSTTYSMYSFFSKTAEGLGTDIDDGTYAGTYSYSGDTLVLTSSMEGADIWSMTATFSDEGYLFLEDEDIVTSWSR